MKVAPIYLEPMESVCGYDDAREYMEIEDAAMLTEQVEAGAIPEGYRVIAGGIYYEKDIRDIASIDIAARIHEALERSPFIDI